MPLKLGASTIDKLYLGADEVAAAYLGADIITQQGGGGGGDFALELDSVPLQLDSANLSVEN